MVTDHLFSLPAHMKYQEYTMILISKGHLEVTKLLIICMHLKYVLWLMAN